MFRIILMMMHVKGKWKIREVGFGVGKGEVERIEKSYANFTQ
jgi:hypothetical protein